MDSNTPKSLAVPVADKYAIKFHWLGPERCNNRLTNSNSIDLFVDETNATYNV